MALATTGADDLTALVGLYAIADLPAPAGLDPLDYAVALLGARPAGPGPAYLQLRAKRETHDARRRLLAALAPRCRAAGTLLIVNDDVEAALAAVVERGDTGPAERLVEVLRDPYDVGPSTAAYTDPPADGDRGYQTFCGT